MGRIDRVNQSIKKEVSDIVQRELRDPRLGFVTITQVAVSKDLQHAKVFFSVLGNNVKIDDVLEGLNSARGFIRSHVAKRVRMRYIPDFLFIHDKSIGYSFSVEQTLNELKHKEEGR